jgi:16S rRNA (cytidine1402-2'-O)-methyltransferase
MIGTLFLVATPIGNLKDISLRAIETLKAVDLIACEDTRHTRKLLTHFGIQNKLISYHEHNEAQRANEIARTLAHGKSVAIVSDAGTPGICDPSFRVVEEAIKLGAQVVSIPGAVAFVNALIASGLPTDSFFFGGFLPAKKNERRKVLRDASEIPATLIFYEAPHRIEKSLRDCFEVLGNRRACLARELTKMHEEIVRGTLLELIANFEAKPPRGEFVLLIERKSVDSSELKVESERDLGRRVAELEKEGLDRKFALKKVAKEFGISKSEAYRRFVTGKK